MDCHGSDALEREDDKWSSSHMAQSCLTEFTLVKIDPERYVDEIAGWVCESIAEGFAAFQVSFMFKPFFGNNSANENILLSSMSRAIDRSYSTAVTRFHRRPNGMPLDKLLRLIACPDWPVAKQQNEGKYPSAVADTNGGLHYGALLLAHPHSRLKPDEVESHINGNPLYAGSGLSLARVHVERITETSAKAALYQLKSLLRLRCQPEYIILLPKDHSEMPGRSWLSRQFGPG